MTAAFSRLPAFTLIVALTAQPVSAQPPAPVEGTRAQSPASPSAAAPQPPPAQQPYPYDAPNARQTRERLHQILRQHSTGVWDVLRSDPVLLNDQNYLQAYPALAAFLQAHPEVARDPHFFVGSPDSRQDVSVAVQRTRLVTQMFGGLGFLIGFMTVAAVIAWVFKTIVDYRRWLRLTKVQTETHTKLVDRFTSNEDLLAYIQTPAGRRFLESGPVAGEAPRSIMAPYGRILWSLQAGTVITVLGAGLLYVSRTLGRDVELADAAPFMFMLGTVAVAIGVGFVLSAFMSYAVSRRLGLIDQPASTHA